MACCEIWRQLHHYLLIISEFPFMYSWLGGQCTLNKLITMTIISCVYILLLYTPITTITWAALHANLWLLYLLELYCKNWLCYCKNIFKMEDLATKHKKVGVFYPQCLKCDCNTFASIFNTFASFFNHGNPMTDVVCLYRKNGLLHW